MTHQRTRPSGLTPQQLERLEQLMRRCHGFSPQNLLKLAYSHLDDVQGMQVQRPELEARLAEAIFHVIDRVASEWHRFSPVEQSWLRAAIEYYVESDDAKPDLAPGGFQDDLEVLNACLRFAGRETWVLDPADWK